MSLRYLLELLLLASIWGASFIFMRIASPEFGPVLLMALRALTASLFLLALIFFTKKRTDFYGYKLKIFIVGLFNTAIPFVLFGYATLTLTAGLTSILNATTSMFGALVAYLWFKEKLARSAAFGLFIGFIGVYLLVYDKAHIETENILLPTLAALLASLCYALSANFTKRYLTGVSSTALAIGSQMAACAVLIPLSLFFMPAQLPSNNAVVAVILLGVVCTGIAYVIFFHLIATIGPTKAISVTYLIPAFGLFWGSVFLNEVISVKMLIGCGFVLTGVALATGLLKRKLRKEDNR